MKGMVPSKVRINFLQLDSNSCLRKYYNIIQKFIVDYHLLRNKEDHVGKQNKYLLHL